MPLARRVTVEAPHINYACSADEDVMLNPTVFHDACRLLNFHPTAGMFASRAHHLVDRYFSADPADKQAMGGSSFLFHRHVDTPYCNPPFSHLSRDLDKLHWDDVHSAMLVAPVWQEADWWQRWKQIVVVAYYFDQPIYLNNEGQLRDMPPWRTVISLIDCRCHNSDYSLSRHTFRAPEWVYTESVLPHSNDHAPDPRDTAHPPPGTADIRAAFATVPAP